MNKNENKTENTVEAISLKDLVNKTKRAMITKTALVKGERYEARIPSNKRAWAKGQGVKFDGELKCWYFHAEDINSHPLKDYLLTNDKWLKLAHPIPFAVKDDFAAKGVCLEIDKETGKWESWVLAIDENQELLEILVELEFV